MPRLTEQIMDAFSLRLRVKYSLVGSCVVEKRKKTNSIITLALQNISEQDNDEENTETRFPSPTAGGEKKIYASG